MNGEVIKSFLVGLGFDVDESSLTKFNKSLANASVKVLALGTAIETTASAIAYGISDISQGFEKMGYEYRIIAPAINKALILRRELLKAYALAGLNITKVIQNSVRLNYSLAKTGFAFKAIYDSVGSRFFGLLTKQSDIFRERLYKNLPKIQNSLEHIIKFVFKAFEATTTLGYRLFEILMRVYEFFEKLDKATSGWSTIVLAIVAAWKLLNLSFLATPLGIVLSLAAALLALYDDYETFKEGGQSLFNWTSAEPSIRAISTLIGDLAEALGDVLQIMLAIVDAFVRLLSGDFSGFWFRVKLGAESAFDALKKVWTILKDIVTLNGAIGDWALNLFGGNAANAGANLNPAVAPPVNPIGRGAQNSQTNQHVNQQTNINVTGSADANKTASAVAGQQGRVNFDMVQNLKPYAR